MGQLLSQAGLEAGTARLFLGVDVGGTTISIVLVDENGVPRGKLAGAEAKTEGDDVEIPVWGEPLGDDHDPRRVCQRIRALAETALETIGLGLSDLCGVGICTPGLMDTKAGIVRSAANLKGWQQVALCDILSEVLGLDRRVVALENDTNAALLAEVWIGAAKGCENAVLMTLGTGIGGAMICDGRLLRGSQGQAGEIGHAILVPDGRPWGGAGVSGIFEGYASATAVAARAREGDGRADGMPKSSALSQLLKPADCKEVFKHAQAGDDYAKSIVSETARHLAIGCINSCRFVDPDVILLAGGMTEAGEFLIEQVRSSFVAYHWNIEPVRVGIKRATLGRHAGAVGAARAALLNMDSLSVAA